MSYCNYSKGDVPIRDDPLEVRHNSSNGQKYVNIPSTKSDKPYSDIQPGQRILPIVIQENYDELPWAVKTDLLLERERELHGLITRKLEINMSEDADPDLFREAEEVGEKIFQLWDKLREEYNLEPYEDTDADLLMRGRIKEDRDKIVEKLSEVKEWSTNRCEELREEYGANVVERPFFDSIVFEIDEQLFSTGSPSTVDGLRRMDDGDAQGLVTHTPDDERSETDEKAVEFVEKRYDTLTDANDQFHEWMETRGYEQVGHVETDHYFEKDGITVIVPWSADSPEDIHIRD